MPNRPMHMLSESWGNVDLVWQVFFFLNKDSEQTATYPLRVLRHSSETCLVIVGVALAKTKEASIPLCLSYGDYNRLLLKDNV